jgi:hypothetical protein
VNNEIYFIPLFDDNLRPGLLIAIVLGFLKLDLFVLLLELLIFGIALVNISSFLDGLITLFGGSDLLLIRIVYAYVFGFISNGFCWILKIIGLVIVVLY